MKADSKPVSNRKQNISINADNTASPTRVVKTQPPLSPAASTFQNSLHKRGPRPIPHAGLGAIREDAAGNTHHISSSNSRGTSPQFVKPST